MWVRSLPAFRASRFQLASPTITRTVDINLTDLEQNHTGQLNVSWKLIYSFNLAGEREREREEFKHLASLWSNTDH